MGDRRGVSSIEYALLLVGILLTVAGGYRALGGKIAIGVKTTTSLFEGGNAVAFGGSSSGGSGLTCSGGTCGSPRGKCFVAGTLVATPSGERPIESLAVGDIVFARSASDGARSARPVLQTYVRAAPSLVDVGIENVVGARERIRSTPEHPYWTLDRGWVDAGELAENEPLIDSSGREARVTKVVPIAQEATVYNLLIDIDHSYFVGHTAVLVHNGSYGSKPVAPVDDGQEEGTEEEKQPLLAPGSHTQGHGHHDTMAPYDGNLWGGDKMVEMSQGPGAPGFEATGPGGTLRTEGLYNCIAIVARDPVTGFAVMMHFNTGEIAPELATKNSEVIAPKLAALKAGMEDTLSKKYKSIGLAPSNVPLEYHIQWGVSWNETPGNPLLNLKPALGQAVGDVFQPTTSGQLVGQPDAAFRTDIPGGDYGWRQ